MEDPHRLRHRRFPGVSVSPAFWWNFTEQLAFARIVNQNWYYDDDFSTMGIQPVLYYNFESIPRVYVDYNASITAKRKGSSDNTWMVL
jgi:hypothetical protein